MYQDTFHHPTKNNCIHVYVAINCIPFPDTLLHSTLMINSYSVHFSSTMYLLCFPPTVDPPPTQNTQSLYNTITSLRIALGFTLVLLFILGPFGLFYLICLYRKTLHSRFVNRVSHASTEKSRICCCQFDIDYDDENKHLSEPT